MVYSIRSYYIVLYYVLILTLWKYMIIFYDCVVDSVPFLPETFGC